jgi:hypothetical protein
MRDIIKHAAEQYRGYKAGFGLWPRSLMKHRTDFGGTFDYRSRKQKLLEKGKHPSQHAINSSGVLERFMPDGTKTETRAALGRTERLLRLLLGSPKPSNKRKPQSTHGRVGGHGSPSSP